MADAILEVLAAAAEEAREAGSWYATRSLVAAAAFEVEHIAGDGRGTGANERANKPVRPWLARAAR